MLSRALLIYSLLKDQDERRRHLFFFSSLLNQDNRKEQSWLHIENFEILDQSVKYVTALQSDPHPSLSLLLINLGPDAPQIFNSVFFSTSLIMGFHEN
ncbi:hypothetical protein R6Q59_016696 [Mikania micrantha]